MPGDHVVLDGAPTVLTAADLLTAVAVTLSTFWPNIIETWLVQTQSQFHLKGVTASQTKFDYVV